MKTKQNRKWKISHTFLERRILTGHIRNTAHIVFTAHIRITNFRKNCDEFELTKSFLKLLCSVNFYNSRSVYFLFPFQKKMPKNTFRNYDFRK